MCLPVAHALRSSHPAFPKSMTHPLPYPLPHPLFVALLQFGAASAIVQASLMQEYRRECAERGGGPHISEPNVEIVEAISKAAAHYAYDAPAPECELATQVAAAANRLVEEHDALIDGSAFSSAAAQCLRKNCADLLQLGPPMKDKAVPIFELMCRVCD